MRHKGADCRNGERRQIVECSNEIFTLLVDLPSTVHAANAIAVAHALLIEACEPPDEEEVQQMIGQMGEAILSHWRERNAGARQ